MTDDESKLKAAQEAQYRQAAEQGDAEAQYELGRVYSRNIVIPEVERFKHKAEAAKWYRKAAEQGHIEAQHQLGTAYKWGLGVHQNPVEANAWFLKAAEQGHVRSMMALGWVREVAELGYAYAQFRLGEMYAQGDGVPQDEAEAMVWYLKAANNTNSDGAVVSDSSSGQAACAIASMYANGKGIPKDDAAALAWYFKAAEKGSAEAPYEIACRYAKGIGLPKDTAVAAEWYCEAESRDKDFGWECFEGLDKTCEKRGIPLEEMVSAYRKRAEQGCEVWQQAMAYLYAHGLGVRQDNAEAQRWLAKAAAQSPIWLDDLDAAGGEH